MQLYKRFAMLLLAPLFLCAMSVTAYAHDVPDTSRKGTISVTLTYEDSPVSGGSFTLYRVGAVSEEDGNYSFVLTGEFTGCNVLLEDIQSAQLAKELADYAADHRVAGTTREIGSEGEVSFTDLELGLYLIVQNTAAHGYSKVDAFLVSVPMHENGAYIYAVEASPKVELERETEPGQPTTPTGPSLPQTGQLNWPVPVLAVLGLCLFSVGWTLRFGKGRI